MPVSLLRKVFANAKIGSWIKQNVLPVVGQVGGILGKVIPGPWGALAGTVGGAADALNKGDYAGAATKGYDAYQQGSKMYHAKAKMAEVAAEGAPTPPTHRALPMKSGRGPLPMMPNKGGMKRSGEMMKRLQMQKGGAMMRKRVRMAS